MPDSSRRRPGPAGALAAALAIALTASATSVVAPATLMAQSTARTSRLVAREAWVRASAPSVPLTAGYTRLENPTGTDITIVAASSPAADAVELHEMRDQGGRATMRLVSQLTVKAQSTLTLAPGGLHFMFIGLRKSLAVGDDVAIELTMQDGSRATMRAPVKAAP